MNKLRNALGLAMRAGKCMAGDYACEKAVKGGTAKLTVLDADASESTRERYAGMCARAGIQCLLVKDMGQAIGKYGRRIAVVTDEGFARMITEAYAEYARDLNQHGGVLNGEG